MKRKALLSIAVGLLVSGCGQPEGPKMPALPDPPAPVPKYVATQIDPQLRLSAERELAAAFSSNDPVLRANAVEAGQRVGDRGAAERIAKAMNDTSPLVRFAATMAAGATQQPRFHARLVELANDPAPTVRVGARYGLHKLGDFSRSHDFETLIQDQDPRVRANAVLALGLLNETSAIKLLKFVEHDSNPAVRLQTTEALHRLGDDNATQRLMAGTISTYADDQIVSLLALVQGRGPTDKIFKLLEGNLTGDYVEVTLAAARALGTLGSDKGMGVALNATTSKDARQRGMAALALGAIGRPDAQPSLRQLLKDADPSVRLAAATAILQLKA